MLLFLPYGKAVFEKPLTLPSRYASHLPNNWEGGWLHELNAVLKKMNE